MPVRRRQRLSTNISASRKQGSDRSCKLGMPFALGFDRRDEAGRLPASRNRAPIFLIEKWRTDLKETIGAVLGKRMRRGGDLG